jgi:hypothetical protein
MAFENSAAVSPLDLVQKLNTFLVANGWTSDMSAADGAGWRVHLHKGAQYVHLRAQMNELTPFTQNHGDLGYSIAVYLGTGFTSGNAWDNQMAGAPAESATPANSVGCIMRLQAGAIPNYYFFTDSTDANVTVVVEALSGIYTHLGWGSVNAIGAITGGDYFFSAWGPYLAHEALGSTAYPGDAVLMTANCPGLPTDPFGEAALFARVDVDSFTGKWISGGPSLTIDELGFTGKTGNSPIFGVSTGFLPSTQFPAYSETFGAQGDFSSQVSAQDGRANLLPVVLYALRDGSGTGYSPFGTLPTIFVCSGVGSGFSAGSDYVIGADTYTVFPNFAVLKVV